MAIGVFCGVVPFIFRRKPSAFKEEDTHKTKRLHTRVIKKLPSMLVPKRSKTAKGSKSRNSCGVKTPKSPRLQNPNGVRATKSPTIHNPCGVAGNFRIMSAIRNKILTLRDLLDLSPCDGSESANELLISTLRDLHKLFPSINPDFSLSKTDGTSIHEKVRCFCDILKSIGEMWTGNDEWMITCKVNSHSKLNDFEYVLALLDDIIKLASERMLEMPDEDEDESEDEDDQTRETSPSPDAFEKNFSEGYSSNNSSLSSSPTSVLPEIITNASKKNAKASINGPLLLSLRVQAVGNRNPIQVKRLAFHMFPNAIQDSNYTVQLGRNVDEKWSNTEANLDFSFSQDCEIVELPEILLSSLEKATENGGIFWTGASDGQAVPARVTFDVLLPPSSISRLQANVTERASVSPSPNILSPKIIEPQVPTPPQPEPQLDSSRESEEPAPSSPSAHITSGNRVTPPLPPPPPPITSENRAVPCPPLPPPRKSENVHSSPSPSPPPLSPLGGLKGMVTPHPLPPKASNGAVSAPPPVKPMGKVAAPPPPPKAMGEVAAPPPPPKAMGEVGAPPPPPKPMGEVAAPPPPPKPMGNVAAPPPPPKPIGEVVAPPPPPKPMGNVAAPPPPPMPMGNRAAPPAPPGLAAPAPPAPPGMAAPAPPPPMQTKKGGGPPPPPPAGGKDTRLKKAGTKLKRSSQMGNLYRSLKGKVEGSSSESKPKGGGGKGKFNNAKGGKPGMADALAEMTKRSAYFQQIEEDVRNHSTQIIEMKKAIASFNTSDMSELITFHKFVESHLEKLTDESQVLARFEDFPSKKLEALRTAATLYSKLDSIVSTLQNWQLASPVAQHLARAERYFNKIKGDVDTLERTKDDECKKLKTHKIQFDFGALVRIKELMVDVSSNCMELALKEKREEGKKEKKEEGKKEKEGGDPSKKESTQQLWKAFQFAFRVYTFAGGQDERAERLTKELAEEIEIDLHP
ncbi:hypothetical protein HAX54_025936 [Datura stramonium]|uniref:Uncharacterized protein n=1 Tax=Datura stramonium TaxID=4076 RepID=A0ABS8V2U4_DATST|nr:hypothetical protein [Datura stramonium]